MAHAHARTNLSTEKFEAPKQAEEAAVRKYLNNNSPKRKNIPPEKIRKDRK
jgi:hypothetical protein